MSVTAAAIPSLSYVAVRRRTARAGTGCARDGIKLPAWGDREPSEGNHFCLRDKARKLRQKSHSAKCSCTLLALQFSWIRQNANGGTVLMAFRPTGNACNLQEYFQQAQASSFFSHDSTGCFIRPLAIAASTTLHLKPRINVAYDKAIRQAGCRNWDASKQALRREREETRGKHHSNPIQQKE